MGRTPLVLTLTVLLVLADRSAAALPPAVGWLGFGVPEGQTTPALEWFRAGMNALGHEEGRTYTLESRFARGDNARFPVLAREILARRPAVVVSPCGPAQRAIREVSRTVPVIAGCADERNFLGEIASLRRPGGATTGFTFLAPESASKRLEILKAIRADVRRVALLHHSGDDWPNYWKEMERVAPGLGITLLRLPVKGLADLNGALDRALRESADALVVFPDATTIGAASRIAEFALKHRLASAFDLALFTAAGGLFSYGPDLRDIYQSLAPQYVDKILKGTKPGDLPVLQPTKFELVFNLKTAKALGIGIPASLLLSADRVIE